MNRQGETNPTDQPKASPREKARYYDELVSLARTALIHDPRGRELLKGLRFRGKPSVLCAFLAAACYAEFQKRSVGSQLTPWDFLLEQIGVSEETLKVLPTDLKGLAESVRATAETLQKLRGEIFDPTEELKRTLPDEEEEQRSEYAEAGAKFQGLPEWLVLFAECLEEIIQQRRSCWGHPRLKLVTLSKALLTRYVRDNSSASEDDAPAPIYASTALLLEIVLGCPGWENSSPITSPKAKALQRVDERAQSWEGQNRFYYDTLYRFLIRRYAEPQNSSVEPPTNKSADRRRARG